jgi:anion-transporting  ArsA/GET3 family ATPase
MTSVIEALEGRDVVVVCGAGGVGKTTIAASLGVGLAERGARVCVVTVDPARRLAGALGLGSGGDEPVAVDGDFDGELYAVQLHAASTFDALVDRHAASDLQAAAIKKSPLYRSLATALGGTQEYMAMERLYELHDAASYDVVVVDTPPTRSALELLDAPDRLLRFLSHRVVRALLTPTRLSLRAASAATGSLLKVISAVVGGELVDDAVAFFRAFAGMQEGFAQRAAEVQRLLAAASTAFVLVTAPNLDAVEEASWFAEHLLTRGISPCAAVVNRCHPRFVSDETAIPESVGDERADSPLAAGLEALRGAQRMARHDAVMVDELRRRFDTVPVGTVELSAAPARAVEELARIAHALGVDDGAAS